jgi:hypothetical protein
MPATAHLSDTQAVIDAAWAALGRTGRAPEAEVAPAGHGEYAPV